MRRALDQMPPRRPDPDVLVGHETLDDAGVVRLTPELALVQTIDFFTPIVDDPFDYGWIAAVNALSDVYAMGGVPRTALGLVCWPDEGLDPAILGRILAGGAGAMNEAGCSIVGGHSIRDEELKFGYAVTGTVHPERIVTNAGARPGDRLVLTKPLGTGVLTTALKAGALSADGVAEAVRWMKAASGSAMERALEAGVHAATDVTGFGLAGHGAQMADESNVTLVLWTGALPLLPGATWAAEAGHVPGGGRANRDHYGPRVAVEDDVDAALLTLAFDPQTSGGLLLAVPSDGAAGLVSALGEAGWSGAAVIGEVVPRETASIRLQAS